MRTSHLLAAYDVMRSGGIFMKIPKISALSGLCLFCAVIAGCGETHDRHTTSPAISHFPVIMAKLPQLPPQPLWPFAVDAITSRTAALGALGMLVTTDDGGIRWYTHDLAAGTIPEAIDFVTPQTGWMAAQIGNTPPKQVIEKTGNGGRTWVAQISAEEGYRSPQFSLINTTSGYVVLNSRLYSTDNGGRTWNPVALPEGDSATGVDFVTLKKGWVAVDTGHNSFQCLYTNNGRLFTPVASSNNLLTPFGLTPQGTGYLLQNLAPQLGPQLGTLEKTTNFGQSWTTMETMKGWAALHVLGYVSGLAFRGADGWIGTTNGAQGFLSSGLLVTANDGASWHFSTQKTQWAIQSLQMVSPGSGWILASHLGNTNFVAVTHDNGKHWRVMWPPLFPLHTDFVDARIGYGLGTAVSDRVILITRDGGLHWSVQTAHTPVPFTGICFRGTRGLGWDNTNTQTGEPLTKVYATDNGGQSWRFMASLSSPSLFNAQVKMFSAKDAVMETDSGPYGTVQGGTHWHLLASAPKEGSVWDFVSLHGAWVYTSQSVKDLSPWGKGASLGWTSNDGHSLNTILSLSPSPRVSYGSAALDFLNRQVGWMLVAKSIRSSEVINKAGSKTPISAAPATVDLLYRTVDGGKHWVIYQFPYSFTTTQVDFVNNQTGYLTVNNGVILKTQDGGRTWKLVSQP